MCTTFTTHFSMFVASLMLNAHSAGQQPLFTKWQIMTFAAACKLNDNAQDSNNSQKVNTRFPDKCQVCSGMGSSIYYACLNP